MRIFVTGATGVVGRRLVPALVDAGYQVTAAARSVAKAEQLARQGATPALLDLYDAAHVRAAVAGHDIVVNLATHIPPASRAFLPCAFRENDRVRREVSRNLVAGGIAGEVGRFIQESVTVSYPDSADCWIDETQPISPPRYARSVVESEAQAERFAAAGGVGVILRFALFYGPDSSHTQDTVAFVKQGKAPTFGSRSGFISSISTDDAAAAVLAALGAPSGIYNVADDRPVRREEYFGSLARALGVPAPWIPPEWLKHLFGSVASAIARSQRVSNARFKQTTGWQPQYASVMDAWPAILRAMGQPAHELRSPGC